MDVCATYNVNFDLHMCSITVSSMTYLDSWTNVAGYISYYNKKYNIKMAINVAGDISYSAVHSTLRVGA